ncbi:MAG: transcriptional repressor [Myxococcota bacterium]|nr:transcriptional repressor [Myxococcota bacterium]
MAKLSTTSKTERFRALLSSKDLRVTEQRLAVLRALSTSRRPVSFSELVDRLAEHGLDRATVYRNLVGLTEVGILIRTQLGDGVARYELPSSGESLHTDHLHLVCIDCGGVSCLPPSAVSLHGQAARRVTEVQLRGHCGGCATDA